MNIDEMTIGQAKELSQMFGSNNNTTKSVIYDGYIGKYVICRTRNEGINAGRVVKLDETGVVLEDISDFQEILIQDEDGIPLKE